MLDDLNLIDQRRAVIWARKFVTDKDESLRLHAALLIFESGDKVEMIPIIAKVLPTGTHEDFGRLAKRAVNELCDVGTDEAVKAALRILDNPQMQRPDAFEFSYSGLRATIIKRLARAGHPEGYRIYLKLLDDRGNRFGSTTYGTPIAKLAVEEIIDSDPADIVLAGIHKIPNFEARRRAARLWIEAKLNRHSPT